METNSIKDGDLVRILNKVPTGANGWGNSWAGDMDDLVGSVGEVQTYRSLSGVGAAGICVYFSEINNYYHFPYFALEKVEPKEKEMKKSYKDRQAEWVKKNGIKVGDNVRLVRTAKDFENGWDNVFASSMKQWVGDILEVNRISDGNIECINRGANCMRFNFPYFVLEKVVEHKDKEWTVSYGLKVKTGQPVLVRDGEGLEWKYSLFSHIRIEGEVFRYATCGVVYITCIPYEGNEHLLGTTYNYEAPKDPAKPKPKFVFGAKVRATVKGKGEKEGVLIGHYPDCCNKAYVISVYDESRNHKYSLFYVDEFTYID